MKDQNKPDGSQNDQKGNSNENTGFYISEEELENIHSTHDDREMDDIQKSIIMAARNEIQKIDEEREEKGGNQDSAIETNDQETPHQQDPREQDIEEIVLTESFNANSIDDSLNQRVHKLEDLVPKEIESQKSTIKTKVITIVFGGILLAGIAYKDKVMEIVDQIDLEEIKSSILK